MRRSRRTSWRRSSPAMWRAPGTNGGESGGDAARWHGWRGMETRHWFTGGPQRDGSLAAVLPPESARPLRVACHRPGLGDPFVGPVASLGGERRPGTAGRPAAGRPPDRRVHRSAPRRTLGRGPQPVGRGADRDGFSIPASAPRPFAGEVLGGRPAFPQSMGRRSRRVAVAAIQQPVPPGEASQAARIPGASRPAAADRRRAG